MFPNNWGFNNQVPCMGQGFFGNLAGATAYPTLNMPGFIPWSQVMMPPPSQGFPHPGNQWNMPQMGGQFFPMQTDVGQERSFQATGGASSQGAAPINPGLVTFLVIELLNRATF